MNDPVIGLSDEKVITFRRYGVATGDTFLFEHVSPRFAKGQRVVIALILNDGVYELNGLYNGAYRIVDDKLDKSAISVGDFKSWIKEVVDGSRTTFPVELPVRGGRSASASKTESLLCPPGSQCHLDGGFATYTYLAGTDLGPMSWDLTKVPVQFKYNHSGAPGSGSSSDYIARIDESLAVWDDLNYARDLFNTVTATTTEGFSNNDNSVILWANLEPYFLAEAWTNEQFDGNGTIKSADIIFHHDDPFAGWHYGATAQTSRSTSVATDYADVLIHELGHVLGLAHTGNQSYPVNKYTMMFATNNLKLITPLRTLSDGDKAGAVYQHPDPDPSGQTTHDILLSASSTVNIDGTWQIASGKELIVSGGTTLKFAQYADIFSRGKVTMVGNSQYQINVQKSGSGQFDYLYMYGSGADGSRLEYVNLNGSKYGIMVNDASVTLKNVKSNLNYYHGLKMWLGAGGTVTDFELDDNGSYGAYIDDSEDVTFVDGTFFSNASGIWVRNNSTVYFGTAALAGDIVIEDSDNYGIAVYLDGYIKTGDNSTGFGGDNTMFDNGTYEVSATTGGEFVGENTYWASVPPSLGRFYTDSGYGSSIDYEPYLSSDPNKTMLDDEPSGELTPARFVKLFNDALKVGRENAFTLADAYRDHLDPRIARKAQVLETRELIRSDKRTGVPVGERLLKSEDFSIDDKAGIAKHLFHAYLVDLDDSYNAERVYKMMAGQLRVDEVDLSVMETLFRDRLGFVPGSNATLSKGASIEDVEVAVSNYPDPFSDYSVIEYSIPNDGNVDISIFDILGRKVATIVDEFQNAGAHTVTFTPGRLTSGTYLYRLTAGEFNYNGRMTLTK